MPSICSLCGEVIEELPHICKKGDYLYSSSFCLKCAKPFGSSENEGWLCSECMKRNRYFTKVFSAFLYRGEVRKRLLEFKYMKRMSGMKNLCDVLAMKISKHPHLPDVLVPVPMSKKRLRRRGFNQSALIAKNISKFLNVPVDHDILIRVEDTPPLYSLGRNERFSVLKNAFALTKKPFYKRVCIIDDIMTSGATVEACARIFVKNGVEEVYAGVIARD
jgi:ComF family protein